MKIAMIILVLVYAATYSFVALTFFVFQKIMEEELHETYRSPLWKSLIEAALWPVQVAYVLYMAFRTGFRL